MRQMIQKKMVWSFKQRQHGEKKSSGGGMERMMRYEEGETYDGMFLTDEHAVADAKIFDQVRSRIDVVLDLEMAAAVLLGCLLVLVRDDEVIDDSLDRCLLLIQVTLMLLNALFTAEKDKSVAQVLLLAFGHASHGDPLHVGRGVVGVLRVLRIRPL